MASAANSSGWKSLVSPEGVVYYYNTKTNETQWEKPDSLKDESDVDKEGDWVWMPSPEDAFIPARRAVGYSDGSVMLTPEHSEEAVRFDAKEAAKLEPVVWSSMRNLEKDLVMLDAMTRPLIMYHLKKRFELNQIYTYVGTILISVNPYALLPLYTPSVLESYIKRGPDHLPPHVYAIADAAYRQMRDDNHSQSVVISGESGAGKTECTKQVLQYLAEIAGSSNDVEQRILAANPILEAFGNAKTVRNNNSSRFGKYVEIYFDVASSICGAKTTSYLLEKIRVVQQSPDERNYHIFYQLVAGATNEQRSSLKLQKASQYTYLSSSGCTEIAGVDDAAEFKDTLHAMNNLGFTPNEINDLFKLLSAVILIGNVTFQSTGDRSCKVSSTNSLNDAASLLSVDPASFNKVVCSRSMKIIGQGIVDIPLSDLEAVDARNALSRFIYGATFDWLVDRINKSIGRGELAGKNSTIGILDIFGFEIFVKNAFEQLCINFANEKLQQFFNQHTFKMEESLYLSEKIKYTHVDYIDNQPVLDLIEAKPTGILPLVDEELIIPKGTDLTLLQKLVERHGKAVNFNAVREEKDCFLVKHYAGDVMYHVSGFLEKNRDKLVDDAYELLSKSHFPFLASLFPPIPQSNAKPTNNKMKNTLSSKFCLQLDELMTTLNHTQPHYIRCIKPNPFKRPLEFHGTLCMQQLEYSGVFEAVQIRKSGYPFRYTHRQFFLRYRCILPDKKDWKGSDVDNCIFLINHMKQNTDVVQIGTKRVLYRAPQHRAMELIRNVSVQKMIIFIQRIGRGYNARKLYKRMKAIVPLLNAAIKSRDIDQLNRVLQKSTSVGFPMFLIKEAERMRHIFLEERRLQQVFALLLEQDALEYYDTYLSELNAAVSIGMSHDLYNKCRAKFDEATAVRNAIEQDGVKALKEMIDRDMKAVLDRAHAAHYSSVTMNELDKLLFDTSEDIFMKKQLKAAVSLGDSKRVISSMIRLKDLFFKSINPESFAIKNYPQLYDPEVWANKKFFVRDKEELVASFLKWTPKPIHHSLTKLPQVNNLRTLAIKMHKNILGYMGDKNYTQPTFLAQELLRNGVTFPEIRAELYIQLIKQLTMNPNKDSQQRGWELMTLFLNSFRPPVSLENYLEFYLRTFSLPSESYILYLSQTMFAPERTSAPTLQEMSQWTAGQVVSRLGYSIAVPDRDTRPARPNNWKKGGVGAGTAQKENAYILPPASEAPGNSYSQDEY